MKRLLMTAFLLSTLGFMVPAHATYPGAPGKLAFYSYNTSRIYTIQPDGTERTTLTGATEEARTPSWSPDGTRIAFSTGHRRTAQIEVMDADGSNRSVVLDNKDLTYLGFWGETWSPDGTTLAFEPRAEGQGFNSILRTTRRQNFLVPPRAHRSFPLSEIQV